MNSEKGFLNLGENNCFVNSILQVLWHLRSFRCAFLSSDAHSCSGAETCVFCELQRVFQLYEYESFSVLSSSSMRAVLARLYVAEDRFQLGEVADAAECLDAILERLHGEPASSSSSSSLSEEGALSCDCAAHRVFGLDLTSQRVCPHCRERLSGARARTFSLLSYVHALREAARECPNLSFGELLRRSTEEAPPERAAGAAPARVGFACPLCHAPAPPRTALTRAPLTLAVALCWPTDRAEKGEVRALLDVLAPDMQVELSHVLHDAPQASYRFRGMVCYYGRHYLTVFYSDEAEEWVIYDDASVRRRGERWERVVEECVRGALQPTLMFFEREAEEAGEAGEAEEAAAAGDDEVPEEEFFDVLQQGWVYSSERTLRLPAGGRFFSLMQRDRLTESEVYAYADVRGVEGPASPGAPTVVVRFGTASALHVTAASLEQARRIRELLLSRVPAASASPGLIAANEANE